MTATSRKPSASLSMPSQSGHQLMRTPQAGHVSFPRAWPEQLHPLLVQGLGAMPVTRGPWGMGTCLTELPGETRVPQACVLPSAASA